MKCLYCTHELEASVLYCTECGKRQQHEDHEQPSLEQELHQPSIEDEVAAGHFTPQSQQEQLHNASASQQNANLPILVHQHSSTYHQSNKDRVGKEFFKELVDVFISVLKRPIEAAKAYDEKHVIHGLVFAVLAVLAFALSYFIIVKRIVELSWFGNGIGIMNAFVSPFINMVLLVAASGFAIYGLLYLDKQKISIVKVLTQYFLTFVFPAAMNIIALFWAIIGWYDISLLILSLSLLMIFVSAGTLLVQYEVGKGLKLDRYYIYLAFFGILFVFIYIFAKGLLSNLLSMLI